MKNLIIGIILGVALSGVAAYFGSEKLKKDAYDSGFTAGTTAGKAEGLKLGTVEGLEQGINEERARQSGAKDSLAAALKENEAALAKARRPRQEKKPPPIQNWRVIGGAIADPIPNEDSSK